MQDVDVSLNPMGMDETMQAEYIEEKRALDLILRSFITYMLANAVELGGKPRWCS